MADRINGKSVAEMARPDPFRRVQRAVHLAGPLPAVVGNEAEAMRWVADRTEGYVVTALPLAGHGGASTLDASGVVSSPRGAVAACLNQCTVPVGQAWPGSPGDAAGLDGWLARLQRARAGVRREYGWLPRVLMRVPDPLHWAGCVFGQWRAALRELSAFRAAVVDAVRRVTAACPDVLLQLDVPAAPLIVQRAGLLGGAMVLRFLAREVAAVFAAAPHGPWVLHVCQQHEGAVTEADMSATVRFLNSVRRCARRMPDVHLALLRGDLPPAVSEATYGPLLGLSRSIRLIAGLASPSYPDCSARALARLEAVWQRPVLGVAPPCVLPHRTPRDAATGLGLLLTLADQAYEPWGW